MLVTCVEWSFVVRFLQDLLQLHETYLWSALQKLISFNFNEHGGSTNITKNIGLDYLDHTSPTSSVFVGECKVIVERFAQETRDVFGWRKKKAITYWHPPETSMAIKKDHHFEFSKIGDTSSHDWMSIVRCNCNYKTLHGSLPSANISGWYMNISCWIIQNVLPFIAMRYPPWN